MDIELPIPQPNGGLQERRVTIKARIVEKNVVGASAFPRNTNACDIKSCLERNDKLTAPSTHMNAELEEE